jgi:putative SOS response-associated peptidase YedK
VEQRFGRDLVFDASSQYDLRHFVTDQIFKPNPMVAAVHNRMPVILGPEHYHWWLQPDRFEPQFLKTLLRPYPAENMACYRVSKLVNNAKHDGPECIQNG